MSISEAIKQIDELYSYKMKLNVFILSNLLFFFILLIKLASINSLQLNDLNNKLKIYYNFN